MRIALVGTELEENLGLRYLAATIMREGHEPVVVAYDEPSQAESVARRLASGRFDVVGMSMMFQLRAREFVGLAERARALGYEGVLIAGGQHATFMAREILEDNPSFDAIVLGDGEAAMRELCARLSSARTSVEALSEIAGLVMRTDDGEIVVTTARTERTDLTTLPAPLRDPVRHRHLGIPSAPMIAGRGCYADCTFCSIIAWEKLSGGPKLRQRPVEHVADEMARLHDEHGVRVFNFHDDNFWLPTVRANRERLAGLERALRQRGVDDIALCLKCRPNDVDQDLFRQARDMGLVRVYVGVETNAPDGLVALRRGVKQPQNQRALDLLAELDVQACSNLLLFDPDTRLPDVKHNIDFLEHNARHTLNFCRVEPYGGTPMTKRLEQDGRLFGDYLGFDYLLAEPRVELLWRICHLAFHDRNFPLDGLSNALIGLSYRFHLAKRFWPKSGVEQLRPTLDDLLARFARSQGVHLRRALTFVERVSLDDVEAIVEHAIDLAACIREEDAELGLECEALVEALETLAVTQGGGRSDGRLGEGASGSGWWHLPEALALSVVLAAGAPSLDASSGGVVRAQDTAGQVAQGEPGASAIAQGLEAARLVEQAVRTTRTAGNNTWLGTNGGASVGLALHPPPRPPFVSNGCDSPPPVPVRHGVLLASASLTAGQGFSVERVAVTSPAYVQLGDVWIAPGGTAVRFRVQHVSVPPSGILAHVGVELRSRTSGTRVLVAAPFWIYPRTEGGGMTPGAAPIPLPPPPQIDRERRFMGCDPVGPLHMGNVVVPIARAVHLAVSEPDAATRSTPWGPVTLVSWLEPSVQGDVTSVSATVARGRVTVVHPFMDARRAQVQFDPRGPDGHVIAGRHRIGVRFLVGRRAYTARIDVEIIDGGARVAMDSLHVETGNASSGELQLPPPRLEQGALGRRSGINVEARRDGTGYVLHVERPRGFEDARISWRVTGGRFVPMAGGDIRWTPPRTRRPVVTCTLTAPDGSVAIGTFQVQP